MVTKRNIVLWLPSFSSVLAAAAGVGSPVSSLLTRGASNLQRPQWARPGHSSTLTPHLERGLEPRSMQWWCQLELISRLPIVHRGDPH